MVNFNCKKKIEKLPEDVILTKHFNLYVGKYDTLKLWHST